MRDYAPPGEAARNPSLEAAAPSQATGPCLARQPILDHHGAVFGYELLYRASSQHTTCERDDDAASARVLSDAVLSLGLDTLTGGRPAFVNFTRGLLLDGTATLLPPSSLVIEVLEDVLVDDLVVDACRALRDRGYAIGLDDFTPGSPAEALIPFVKFVKVDVMQTPLQECNALAARLRPLGIRMVAEKVETTDSVARLLPLGFRLFQGYYFCRPTTFMTLPLRGRQLAYTRLLAAINQDNLTAEALEELVKSDATLTYRVLRTINSPGFGLPHEISSLRQALVLLGRDRIRKWLSIWTLAGLNTGQQPEELLSTALVRARCCEAIGAELPAAEERGAYFLLGLCSVIDAILRRPMLTALSEVPVPGFVRDALLGEANRARQVLNAVNAYEEGEWNAAAAILDDLHVPMGTLSAAYEDALQWTRSLSTTPTS